MNKTNLGKVVGAIVGFAIAYAVVAWIMPSGDKGVEKELRAVSEQMNKNCPVQIDAVTVLVSTTVLPPKTLRYTYTVNVPEGMDGAEVIRNLEPSVKEFVRTSPDMAYLRGKKVVFSYYYTDQNRSYLYDFDVTPEEYDK